MDPQLALVLVTVLTAVLYLGRRAWRTWAGGCNSGCGSCGHSTAPRQATGQITFIPSSQLSLRRRD